ncbi:MAG: cell division protein FtsQ/DivIB [Planctomycetota bacterium]|jgi:hypothetical protein
MGKRKKKKTDSKRITYIFGKGKHGRKSKRKKTDWKTLFTVFGTVVGLGLVGYGLIFLLTYPSRVSPVKDNTGPLELVGTPTWLNEELKTKILKAACAGGEDLKLDEDSAKSIQQNLEKSVWLYDVRVQTTSKSFLISGKWRTPIAKIRSGLLDFYIDADMTVLDHVVIEDLEIIEITDFNRLGRTIRPGHILESRDISAAVLIIDSLSKMDIKVAADKPLLGEISRIDVRNYNGRRRRKEPHIVLYTIDDTQIQWGAEIGKWSQNFECSDKEKLGKLYSHYKEYGTLLGDAKFINLREPENRIPLPIDRF